MKVDWDEVINGTIFGLVQVVVISLVLYSFSAKQHKGYYLKCSSGLSTIMINWENAPDEAAFMTFDGIEALEVLKKLKAIHAKEHQ